MAGILDFFGLGKSQITTGNRTMQTFISDINGHGVATSDSGRISIAAPKGFSKLPGLNTAPFRRFTLRTSSFEFPGRNISTMENRTYGPIQKYAYNQIMTDLSIGIILSDTFEEKWVFDQWHDLIVNAGITNRRSGFNNRYPTYDVGYYDDYVSAEVLVEQIDTKGIVTYACVLEEAYPLSTQQLTIDWNSTNIQILQVQFAFKNWFVKEHIANRTHPAKPPISWRQRLNPQGLYDVTGLGSDISQTQ